jgi:putative PIN family toxin of toxin-antitoxin system
MMTSYVLDTDVMVAALRSSRGASRQLLLGALEGQFELRVSVPLFLEYEAVLTRPEQLAAFGLARHEVEVVLNDLAAVAKPVRLAFRWRPSLPDPADGMVLETAVNGSGDAIVTFNRRHFREVRDRFRCAVLAPGQALQHLRRRDP